LSHASQIAHQCWPDLISALAHAAAANPEQLEQLLQRYVGANSNRIRGKACYQLKGIVEAWLVDAWSLLCGMVGVRSMTLPNNPTDGTVA
jgi:hypothetical protein